MVDGAPIPIEVMQAQLVRYARRCPDENYHAAGLAAIATGLPYEIAAAQTGTTVARLRRAVRRALIVMRRFDQQAPWWDGDQPGHLCAPDKTDQACEWCGGPIRRGTAAKVCSGPCRRKLTAHRTHLRWRELTAARALVEATSASEPPDPHRDPSSA